MSTQTPETGTTGRRRIRPRWIVLGCVVLVVSWWMTFGHGLWSLLTTARDPDELDPAIFNQASATQWEAVADGLVTRDEYAAAYDREVDCIRTVAADVSVTGPSWDRLGWTLGYTTESKASPEDLGADQCALEHRALTEVVWVEQPPDDDGVVGAMGSVVGRCLETVRSNGSIDGCPEALLDAAPSG